ncbi:plasmid mobilization protein [Arsenophonus sp.]|uniref:plasmid mobilization protein n=1 Tax=Arsenophonus sp. TaxID=1872640 RepID=UPI00387A3040
MKKDNKNIHITFRLTESEYAPFKEVIDTLGLSKSEFFRLLLTKQLDPDIHNKINSEKYDRLLFYFNKTSNNINQIATRINTAYQDGMITEQRLIRWLTVLNTISDNLLSGIEHDK